MIVFVVTVLTAHFVDKGISYAGGSSFSYQLQQDNPCSGINFPYTLTGATNAERIMNLNKAIDCANNNSTSDVIDLNGQRLILWLEQCDVDGGGQRWRDAECCERLGRYCRSGEPAGRWLACLHRSGGGRPERYRHANQYCAHLHAEPIPRYQPKRQRSER